MFFSYFQVLRHPGKSCRDNRWTAIERSRGFSLGVSWLMNFFEARQNDLWLNVEASWTCCMTQDMTQALHRGATNNVKQLTWSIALLPWLMDGGIQLDYNLVSLMNKWNLCPWTVLVHDFQTHLFSNLFVTHNNILYI